jgi:hypothetical protein
MLSSALAKSLRIWRTCSTYVTPASTNVTLYVVRVGIDVPSDASSPFTTPILTPLSNNVGQPWPPTNEELQSQVLIPEARDSSERFPMRTLKLTLIVCKNAS